MIALFNGYTDIAKLLLEDKRTDINTKDKLGKTPLILARSKGQNEIVQIILEKEGNISDQQNENNTNGFGLPANDQTSTNSTYSFGLPTNNQTSTNSTYSFGLPTNNQTSTNNTYSFGHSKNRYDEDVRIMLGFYH